MYETNLVYEIKNAANYHGEKCIQIIINLKYLFANYFYRVRKLTFKTQK